MQEFSLPHGLRLTICLSMYRYVVASVIIMVKRLKRPSLWYGGYHGGRLICIISRAHSFPRAAEFRAEPRNLAVAAEFQCFRGISRNSA